ncbi:hypothetical protein GIW78_08620 [Pseudomonas syringae]|nr:hypothetical protein [Pseudomonas syringae]PBP72337.1 hypothetical protein CCL21_05760 [Pseudomonas syringae]
MLFLAQTIKNKLNALSALMSSNTIFLKWPSRIKRCKVIQIIRLYSDTERWRTPAARLTLPRFFATIQLPTYFVTHCHSLQVDKSAVLKRAVA